MEFLITICARGGSKGIPGKNIKLLANRPLIEYTLEIARNYKNTYSNTDIALSTDSESIISIAITNGFEVPYKRPEFLATDSVGKIDAIEDVLNFYEKLNNKSYDYVLDLDVTSPLRNLEDLSQAFSLFENNKPAYNLFSVSKAARNPYFNMVEEGADGFYHLPKKLENSVLSRQAAPKVYELNASFYFYRRVFFEKGFRSAITDKSLIYEVPHLCFDLDHPIDFDFLSYLIENKKLDFKWP